MTRALGPKVGIGREAAAPLALLALCWLPAGLLGILWIGGHAASWTTRNGWDGPGYGFQFAEDVALGAGVGPQWPGTPSWLIWGLSFALLLVTVTLAGFVMARLVHAGTAPGDPLSSLATAADVAALTPTGVTSRAVQLRSSLQGVAQPLAASDTGVGLGRLQTLRGEGPELRASWEDVVLAVMAPRAGKTTALAVPAILDAPGPVVATSNKADLWAATASLRRSGTAAPVWVFDPQRITGVKRTWWWNPLRGVTNVEEAHRLAGHFVQEVRGDRGDRDFWTAAAHDLLTGLLLAAALSRQSLVEVYEWLNDPVLSTPVQILREHRENAAAASLSGRQHGAPETRDGVYETARTAAQSLRDSAIMAWVTPPSRPAGPRREFDAGAFPGSRQSLYLLSKDGAGAAAPLVAALTDRVMREATRAAERAGGRLDPPMVVVLDEAANVCRISDLPELYSHLGSRGVVPLTILQSYRQGTRVWGEHGMDAMWSAATCKVIGAGLDDARLAEDISRLVGEHDVPVRSISRGDGRASESLSLRRQRILPPEKLRALPRGSALVLATGCPPAMATLTPWYAGDRAREVTASVEAAGVEMTTRSAGAGGLTHD